MKKILFFSLAVAGMLTSCSSDDSVNMSGNEANIGSGVPIELSFGSNVTTSTRGTGTVGYYSDSAANVWHNQTVHIYMLEQGTMNLASLTKDDNGEPIDPIYDNEPFLTPGKPFANMDPSEQGPRNSGIARPANSLVKYYPIMGNFDFYGYRVDDAKIETGYPKKTATDLKVKFTMNGSQDIMAARAYVPFNSTNLPDPNRYYSAYAARRNVQPVLDFKHLLSRFSFEVIPTDSGAVDSISGVLIDSIVISTTKHTAEFTIARIPTAADSTDVDSVYFKGKFQKDLEWFNENQIKRFALMQRDTAWHYYTEPTYDYKNNLDSLPLVPLDSVDLRKRTQEVAVGVGEAMFLAPDVDEYDATIYVHQWTKLSYDSIPFNKPSNLVKKPYDVKAKIKLQNGAKFKQGYSYKVSIRVSGLQEIVLRTVLTGWDKGEDITIMPEEDENPIWPNP